MSDLFLWTYDGPHLQSDDDLERLQEARLLDYLIDDDLGPDGIPQPPVAVTR